jgi:predicted kinase
LFVLINGSFGIGKSTLAELLVQILPAAAISDPERIGYVLRRLPPWMLGRTEQPPDYQDLAQWRTLIGIAGRLAHRGRRTVIIPMAFTNLDYLEGFARTLAKTAPVERFCLVAPIEVIRERLVSRAAGEGRKHLTEFEQRRSLECAMVHGTSPAYGLPLDACRKPEIIAEEIKARLARARATSA